jgi:acyl dehydratase
MRTVTIDELPGLLGATLGPSPWVLVDQDSIDAFGRVTHDLQWIHVDPVAAKEGPFGTTIAHGYLTLSLVPHLMSMLLQVECRQTLNYGAEKIRPAGTRVRLSVTAASVEEVAGGYQAGFQAAVEAEGSSKPVCVAHVVYRFLR